MCLILIAYRAHPDYPLVVAANRDEYFARPTAAASFWPEAPHCLAGRDLEAGGTWLGVTRAGRFAALTNVREPSVAPPAQPISRGLLVRDFLLGTAAAPDYIKQLDGSRHPGFNLLCGTVSAPWFFSNRHTKPQPLPPGVHGLSNATLNTPWPKVESGRAALSALLQNHHERANPLHPDDLLPLLNHRQRAVDATLPDTGVGLDWERTLSSRFIEGQSFDYGTRASTALMVDRHGKAHFTEWQWNEQGQLAHHAHWPFEVA